MPLGKLPPTTLEASRLSRVSPRGEPKPAEELVEPEGSAADGSAAPEPAQAWLERVPGEGVERLRTAIRPLTLRPWPLPLPRPAMARGPAAPPAGAEPHASSGQEQSPPNALSADQRDDLIFRVHRRLIQQLEAAQLDALPDAEARAAVERSAREILRQEAPGVFRSSTRRDFERHR